MIVVCILLYLIAGLLTAWGFNQEEEMNGLGWLGVTLFWPILLFVRILL